MNLRSLIPKFSEFLLWMNQHAPVVCAVTESWLHHDVESSEITIPGYEVFRADRRDAPYGGVVLYVSVDLRPSLLFSESHPSGQFELLWVQTNPSDALPITFGVCYRSPGGTSLDWFQSLQRFSVKDRVCLMGDFNCPHIRWDTMSLNPGATRIERLFLDFTVNSGLTQLVQFPTRLAPSSASCLDLILVSDDLMFRHVRYDSPISTSDHAVVLADFLRPITRNTPCQPFRNYWKLDVMQLRSMALATTWTVDSSDSVHAQWTTLKHSLEVLTANCVPVTTPSKRRRHPPWITRDIVKKLAMRKKAWCTFASTGSAQNYHSYAILRNQCKAAVRSSRKAYEESLLASSASHPKRFFAYINRCRRRPTQIPDLLSPSGSLCINDNDKATLLADHFGSIYIDNNVANPYGPQQEFLHESISDLEFSVSDVYALLHKLNPAKAPGPDGIHPRILKHIADIIAPTIFCLFRASLDQGVLPDDWKRGLIRPIHKGGDAASPENYRPICLTSVLVKTLERLIRTALDRHLISNNLLPATQHGFVPRKSCVTNLLLAREAWSDAWERKQPVHSVFIDFSRAFDRVNHSLLLHKLCNLGITGKLYDWIAAYLRNRTWRVGVNHYVSGPRLASSGVPQGAVLGPRLFTIFVHDLPSVLRVRSLMFADDLKVWAEISTTDDHLLLQQDLHHLWNWAERNALPINPAKSSVLHISRQLTVSDYTLGSHRPSSSLSVKDLGLITRHDLKTNEHTEKARSCGLKLLWMIKRSISFWSPAVFRKVMVTFIRPAIEYAAPAFFPCSRGEVTRLEYVQRLGSRLVPSLRKLTYPDRCKTLDLFTLEYRRIRADLILYYRVLVRGDFPDLEHLLHRSATRHTRGHQFKLEVWSADIHRWSRRLLTTWNCLPENVISAPTVNVFKTRMDEHFSHLAYGGVSIRERPLRGLPAGRLAAA